MSTTEIPRAIREAPIKVVISMTQINVIVSPDAAVACPVCHTARAFFVVRKKTVVDPWEVRCSGCDYREERAAA